MKFCTPLTFASLKWHSYINSARAVLSAYDGRIPFAPAIRQFFAANKKMGSRDRKWITHLCYCYFRGGRVAAGASMDEQIINGLFLCSDQPNELLAALAPALNDSVALSGLEKINLLGFHPEPSFIFPQASHLQAEIDALEFALSHLVQPDVFLRIRPGKHAKVMSALRAASLSFSFHGIDTVALPNAAPIQNIIDFDREAVVQDLSSQATGDYLQEVVPELFSSPATVWDCCAASGGKSIMLHDRMPGIGLTVSDIRESIISNLRKRFAIAMINDYDSFVADTSTTVPDRREYDLVVADVPCSGSGTWGRTPEQLHFFTESRITEYAILQRKIVANAARAVRKGGYLYYITCSVFREENEDNVKWIVENTGFKSVGMRALMGYRDKADSLFAAVFRKPS